MSVRLRLWAPIWAVGHLGTYRGFRKIGLPSAFSALCGSRMMTVEQARRLGWRVETLRFLAEYPIWHRTVQEYYSQTWTPPPVSLAPPSREQVKQLIQWAEGRPDERDDIDRQADAGLPYPRSSPAEISLDQILRVAGSGLPYAIFTTLHEELDLAFESQFRSPYSLSRRHAEVAARRRIDRLVGDSGVAELGPAARRHGNTEGTSASG